MSGYAAGGHYDDGYSHAGHGDSYYQDEHAQGGYYDHQDYGDGYYDQGYVTDTAKKTQISRERSTDNGELVPTTMGLTPKELILRLPTRKVVTPRVDTTKVVDSSITMITTATNTTTKAKLDMVAAVAVILKKTPRLSAISP